LASSDFCLSINGLSIVFDPESDCQQVIVRGLSQVTLKTRAEGYDYSRFTLVVGAQDSLPGFVLRFYRSSPGELAVEGSDLDELAGQKLFGSTTIALHYMGKPIPGSSTRIQIEPAETTKQQVAFMRNDLEKINSTIVDFYGLSQEYFTMNSDDKWREYHLDLERFMILNQFYSQAVMFLSAQPEMYDCELMSSIEYSTVPIRQARPLTAHNLLAAYRNREKFFDLGEIADAAGALSVQLPARVPIKERKPHYNTRLNQQALAILHHMIRETEQIMGEIDRLREEKSNLSRSLVAGYAVYTDFEIDRLRTANSISRKMYEAIASRIDLFESLGVENKAGSKRPMVSVKPIYTSFFAAYRDYRNKQGLLPRVIDTGEQAFPLQTHSINRLYEIWVVNIVVRVMINNLGFKLINEHRSAVNYLSENDEPIPLVKKPLTLTMLSPKGDIVMYNYNKKYPPLDSPFCSELVGAVVRSLAGRGPVRKDNPDISIEFYSRTDKPYRIIILDATFSGNPEIHRDKALYEETILYRPDSDAPRHQWRHIVRALAIHPFNPNDGLPIRHEAIMVPSENACEETEVWLRTLFEDERLI